MLKRALPALVTVALFVGLALVAFCGLARGDDPFPFYVQSNVVSSQPGSTSGAMIEDDAGTVLHWEAASWNWFRFPEALNNAYWQKSQSTVTPDASIAPNGTLTADAIVDNVTSASTSVYVFVIVSAVPSAVRTVSASVKPDAYPFAFLQGPLGNICVFSLSGLGAVTFAPPNGACTITPEANGFYRIAQLNPAAVTTGGMLVGFSSIGTAAALNCPRTVGTVGGYAWGLRQNLGPVPLPYVSNPGNTVGGAGDTFAMNGTVPLALTSSLYPRGFATGRRAVGPYSGGNRFTGTTTDGMHQGGDFTVCVAFNPGAVPGGILGGSGDGATAGWYFQVQGGNNIRFATNAGLLAISPTAAVPNAMNVVCGGRLGGSSFSKVNGGGTGSNAVAYTPGALISTIGAASGGASSFSGTIREWWVSSTAWDEANVAAIEAAAMQNGGPGALFQDDANTVFHAIGDAYNGTTWGTPFGNLTTVGAVGFSDAFVPPQSSGLPMLDRIAYGPYSGANFFALGTGSDVLDFTGDFSACLVFTGGPANGMLAFDGVTATTGWAAQVEPTPVPGSFWATDAGTTTAISKTTNGAVTGVNVACFGRSGTNVLAKLNLGAIVSTALGHAVAPGTATPANLGGTQAGNDVAWTSGIFEVWASTTTPSDVLFTKIQQRVLQQVGAYGDRDLLLTSRNAVQSVPVPGPAQPTLFYAPPLVVATSPQGITAADATTNLALQSEALATAPWVATGTVVTADQAVFVDGQTTMEKLDSTGQPVASFVAQLTAVPSSTGPWTTSAWVAATAGTSLETVGMTVGAALIASCTCTSFAMDGSAAPACTPGNLLANGFAFATVGTAPVRLSVTCTSNVATTAVSPFVEPGQWNTSVSTGFFGGVQFEAHGHPTSYLPTAAATVSRTRDAVTYANGNPFATYQGPFCLDVTSTPSWGRGWTSDDARLIHVGTVGAPHQTFLQANAVGNVTFSVVDAATAFRTVTFAAGYTGASEHRLTGCSDQAGNLTLYSDGAGPVGAVAGAGTGIMTMSSALPVQLLGSNGSANAEADASIRNVKLCRGTPAQCL